jgi:hypothetical protein
MRVLCCLDGTNGDKVSKATEMLSATQPLALGILYVIDTGPRKDIEQTRERFFRRPGAPRSREDEMEQAELASAQDVLTKDCARFPTRKRSGVRGDLNAKLSTLQPSGRRTW